MAKLSEIIGIDEPTIERLRAQKIASTITLLEKGATPEGRDQISSSANVPLLTLMEWLYRADLERINGVAWLTAELLAAAGVTSVPDLSYRTVEELHPRVLAANEEHALIKRPPSVSQLAGWIEQARQMPAALSFPPNEAF
jgi:hypothetical protein